MLQCFSIFVQPVHTPVWIRQDIVSLLTLEGAKAELSNPGQAVSSRRLSDGCKRKEING